MCNKDVIIYIGANVSEFIRAIRSLAQYTRNVLFFRKVSSLGNLHITFHLFDFSVDCIIVCKGLHIYQSKVFHLDNEMLFGVFRPTREFLTHMETSP